MIIDVPDIIVRKEDMPQILDVLMLGRCSHEFSWPRRAADGEYYQVCLLCAAQYKYDWKTMRRIKRVEPSMPEPTVGHSRSHTKRPSWVPRARRLKLQIPLSYRTRNLGTWSEGTIENISQSGVLFQGPEALPLNGLVEMVFEMPEVISGQKKSKVLCQGRIIRSKEGRDPAKLMVLVAAILDYKFLHQD